MIMTLRLSSSSMAQKKDQHTKKAPCPHNGINYQADGEDANPHDNGEDVNPAEAVERDPVVSQ